METMRPTAPHLLLVSSILLLLLLSPAVAHRPIHGAHHPIHGAHHPIHHGRPSAVLAVCAKTRDPALCQRAIAGSLPPPPRTAVTPSWVLEKHIGALKKQTQAVVAFAQATCRKPKMNEVVVTALRACVTGDYAGSMYALDRASKRLATRDVPALKIEISAVLSGYGYCDDEFVEIPYSPVKLSNLKLSDTARILLDLATLV